MSESLNAKLSMQTVAKHRLIVPVPRRQVSALHLLHRLSPRLVQPITRNFERIVDRGWPRALAAEEKR
ncbi:MAG: hypothetical protein ACYDA6_10175 [Solirubrobacteraceae bacterium]